MNPALAHATAAADLLGLDYDDATDYAIAHALVAIALSVCAEPAPVGTHGPGVERGGKAGGATPTAPRPLPPIVSRSPWTRDRLLRRAFGVRP